MSDRAEMAERHGRILAELAELGLSSARDLHQQQLAAETPEQKAALANSLHRISRSLRQTLALEARLARDARRTDLEDRTEARRDAARRVAQRRQRVEATVERLIWTEYEDSEAGILVDDLDMLLDEAELTDGFCADPVEAHIQRICEELGLPIPPPSGEVSPEATEGASAADSQLNLLSGPPQSLRDSSPEGGAIDWRSSA
jgi:hypothetical protein